MILSNKLTRERIKIKPQKIIRTVSTTKMSFPFKSLLRINPYSNFSLRTAAKPIVATPKEIKIDITAVSPKPNNAIEDNSYYYPNFPKSSQRKNYIVSVDKESYFQYIENNSFLKAVSAFGGPLGFQDRIVDALAAGDELSLSLKSKFARNYDILIGDMSVDHLTDRSDILHDFKHKHLFAIEKSTGTIWCYALSHSANDTNRNLKVFLDNMNEYKALPTYLISKNDINGALKSQYIWRQRKVFASALKEQLTVKINAKDQMFYNNNKNAIISIVAQDARFNSGGKKYYRNFVTEPDYTPEYTQSFSEELPFYKFEPSIDV